MNMMKGKRLIFLSMMSMTCLIIGVFFATNPGLVIRFDYRAMPGTRTYAFGMFNNKTDFASSGTKTNKTSYSNLKDEAKQPPMKISVRKTPCYRQIQQWVGPESPQEPVVVAECPGLECGFRFVKDTSFQTMAKSHVVLHDVLRSRWQWDKMQMNRPPNQAWVFWSQEPTAYPNRQYRHLYNYTITHRRRPYSTIYTPYGFYDNSTPQIFPNDSRNWAQGRPNMVAWAASNCKRTRWRRLDFVKKLSEHIQVDIYGGCGKKGCNRRTDSCWNLLRTYKFYMAIENSECRDYITEKFWENSLAHDLLPIVHGAPKEDYDRVAPPHSFIHMQDFSSMEELVDYLNLVSSNETLYNSYFEWKRHGSAISKHDPKKGPTFACDLVSKVLDFEKGLPSGRSNEGANSEAYDMLPKLCDIASGFPHDF